MFSHSFLPLINRPTRIISHTASLIDNIFTNHFPNDYMTSGVIFSDISDHLPIFTFLGHSELHNSKPTIKLRRRLINSKSKKKFKK